MPNKTLSNLSLLIPYYSLGDDYISDTPGEEIDSSKVWHLGEIMLNWDTEYDDAPPASREDIILITRSLIWPVEFGARLRIDGSNTSLSLDLKDNGNTMLDSALTLTHSTGDGVVVTADISDSYLLNNGVPVDHEIRVQLTNTSATGALGLMAWLRYAFLE